MLCLVLRLQDVPTQIHHEWGFNPLFSETNQTWCPAFSLSLSLSRSLSLSLSLFVPARLETKAKWTDRQDVLLTRICATQQHGQTDNIREGLCACTFCTLFSLQPTMASVFISNVDDYVAPSQACVNPLFSSSEDASKNETTTTTTTSTTSLKSKPDNDDERNGLVKRGRRRRRRAPPRTNGDATTTTTTTAVVSETTLKETARVTMADCLACSGCVTTAETVLVEQHSLSTLRDMVQPSTSGMHTTKGTSIVFTVSPAVWADLYRHLGAAAMGTSNGFPKQWTAFLHQSCRASMVMDGTMPLHWSLLEAAHEFCHAYRQQSSTRRNDKDDDHVPVPSVAISAHQSQIIPRDGGPAVTVAHNGQRTESKLPLVSSSCPALVCLVEKTHPKLVRHLATTKSPMAMAGAYLKSNNYKYGEPTSLVHIAVMPCHDKKLEASRKDLSVSWTGNDTIPDVDLVITTKECLQLLQEASGSDNVAIMREYLMSLSPSVVTVVDSLPDATRRDTAAAVVLVQPPQRGPPPCAAAAAAAVAQPPPKFVPYVSGGYADFIFRYAAHELFGYRVGPEQELPWKPVETLQRKSARVASRKPQHYAITLYRCEKDGSYSLHSHDNDENALPVLRFATAYGLQTLQRVIRPLERGQLMFDYVEAMACPSGCINGGGQIPTFTTTRENPTETRRRVQQTEAILLSRHGQTNTMSRDVYATVCPDGPFGKQAQQLLHTRFHVVPPLQLTMGATAGVALQDTKW